MGELEPARILGDPQVHQTRNGVHACGRTVLDPDHLIAGEDV